MSHKVAVHSIPLISDEDQDADEEVLIRSKKKRRIEVSSESDDDADVRVSPQPPAASSSTVLHSPSSSPPRRLSRLRRGSAPEDDSAAAAADDDDNDNDNAADGEDHQERKQEGEKKKPSNTRRSTRASSSMDVSDGAASEAELSDTERKSPSNERKYGLRGSARSQKLNDSEKSALERLLRDRAKASAVDDADEMNAAGSASSPRLKRKRLFQSNAAAVSSSSSADKKGTSEADRQAKYDRLEQIIHKDDKQYSDDMDDDDESYEEEEKDKAPSRWKASYNAEKEAAELRKVERAEAARAAELERNMESIREEKFERFKAREEKKKNRGRQGKGQATRKQPRKSKQQDDEEYDDDFVVPDDEMDEESYDSSVADEYMHQQFDEEQFIEEERQMSGKMMEASITPRDAFELWCRYLCGTIIEADYTGVIDRNTRLRVKFAAAMKLIEEQFNMKVNQWVKSQTWERKECADILHRMNSLAYSTSMEATSLVGCEVCLPKKGHAHQATHALSYFGVEYEPKELHHPFRESKIIIGKVYEQHTFNTGVLCHQRLKLFHVMKHYKLHVMLSLKARMKKLCMDRFKENEPPSRADCYELMEAVLKDVATINTQFKIWDRLRSVAESYSMSDSRKVFVDLNFLTSCQDFDHEECLLELFSWRRVGAKDGFNVSEHIIRTEQERDQKMATRLETTRRVAVAADEEDEYEVDEEAEAEAAEAERQEEQKRKKRSKHAHDVEDDLDEEDYELLREAKTTAASVSAAAAVESSVLQQQKQQISSSLANLAADKLKNGVGNGQASLSSMWQRRQSETPPATSSSVVQSSAPTVAASSSNPRSHLPPPSSAESIQDESDVEVVAPPSAGAWRRKATLSFSHAASSSNSPPKATQSSSSPPVSATRSNAPAKGMDGEALFEVYKSLHAEEQINFLQLAGATAEKSHLIAFVKAAPQQFRVSVKEFLEEAEGVL